MATYIVLLGPPGVGKGTQAEIIARHAALPHVSSGDLFRENIKNGTLLGNKAESYIKKGELVPDELTIGMIRERLKKQDCISGALLDGFPRTIIQAEALDKLLAEFNGRVDHVPFISAPEQILVERLSGRWTCKAQGHIFHQVFNPPKTAGVCDQDGSPLVQREDDKAETVRNRIRVYFDQTAPLITYYKLRNLLHEIDGNQSIEKITADLLTAIR
jgi:adenylate kinase